MITTERVVALPSDEALVAFRQRAAVADDRNEYFHDDLAELRTVGYLGAAVQTSLGGGGLSLAQLATEQRRLARFAPATALAMCMHHYWVGLSVELARLGDHSCDWIQQAAVDGELFAAGHAEIGNDVPVIMSTAQAEPVRGGYRFTGHKMFGSNGPAWSYLGAHALDVSVPDSPKIVHGFVRRGDDGVSVRAEWDTLGMRASQSYDTVLHGVFVPDDRIGAVTPAGSEEHPFLMAMNIWALPLIANVYLGLADRALVLAVESATTKTSVAIPGGSYAHNPMVQHQIAEMYLELDAAGATVDRVVDDWQTGVEHGSMWAAKIPSAKWRAVEAAKRVVDLALDVAGGGAMLRGNELERLYRDARCGGFHPANDALTHESVAKTVLGLDPTGPRW